MKGIILAGGRGTRLYPLTKATSKQLLPVYNKPMVFYPLAMLMIAGIKEILVISTPETKSMYQAVLGNGFQWGIKVYYEEQLEPKGLAEAFIIGEEFIGEDSVCMILGDNIFFGMGLRKIMQEAAHLDSGAIIFAYRVDDPNRYGIVEFDQNKKIISIEEKPNIPRSEFAVPGIYFYDNKVVDISKKLNPSSRGELEITDVNLDYLNREELSVIELGRGIAWLDAGTHDSLLQASNFVYAIETRQGLLISSPDEIAFVQGWISKTQLTENIKEYNSNSYGKKLEKLLS